MYIEEIEWLDKEGKEAIVKVANNANILRCFSCPCTYNIGDVLTEPLECLDVQSIILCETNENSIEKLGDTFKYKLKGEVKDVQNGIVKVFDFELHIDEEYIPGDILNGMYIQFSVSRIDIW